MVEQYDFAYYRNWRGWHVVRPLSDAAVDLMALYEEAAFLAETFGDPDGAPGEHWFEAYEAPDVVEGLLANGLTCEWACHCAGRTG